MKIIGRVIDIFIPDEYQNNGLLDIMDRTNIGFKIMTDDGIEEIVLKQDEINTKIMKDDIVVIIRQEISGKEFIDIEPFGGDYDE